MMFHIWRFDLWRNSAFLIRLIAMLLTYPEVQERIHAELDEIVGKGAQVTLEHRGQLLFTEAVILETQRMYPLVACALPHMATKDASIGGYVLPTGTVQCR